MTTGIANNLRIDSRVLGPGILWGGMSIPTAGARTGIATVDADGLYTPLLSDNASAYPIGATDAGSVCSLKPTSTDMFCDEILAPVDRKLQAVEMTITCNLLGLLDSVVTTLLLSGFGSYSTSSGYKQNTIGYATDSFTGICLIAPRRDDTTKVLVFHIYKAINDTGMVWGVNHKGLGNSPTTFKGYAITTRTLTDQVGNFWWQI